MRFGLARRWAVAALAVLLVGAGAAPGVRAGALSDLDGHWAAANVQAAIEAGLVTGYPDGSFRPDEPVTRAEFIALMERVRGVAPQAGDAGFVDVHSHWLAQQGLLQAAVQVGLVVPSDYGDPPALQPDRAIPRLEAAVLAVRTMNRLGAALTLHGAPLPYKDDVPAWTTGYLAAAYSAGVMKGQGPDTFGARLSLTRAEAAVIAMRVRAAAGQLAGGTDAKVPVWEGNSWEVRTIPDNHAVQVVAAPDGTLYWVSQDGGDLWQQKSGADPVVIYKGLETRGAVPMAAGPDGVYVAQNFGVLRITPDGQAATWVGNLAWGDDNRGYKNGQGTGARFESIDTICTDPVGNLYVAEAARVRKVDPQGNVTLLAGRTPRQDFVLKQGLLLNQSVGEVGDGPGYLASLGQVKACAADGAGNVYVAGQDTISKVGPDGTVSWLAGGTRSESDGGREEAGFSYVTAMAVDAWGDLWLAESTLNRIRRITPDGHIYTVAGGGGQVVKMHNMGGTEWPQWLADSAPADGPGPGIYARFGRITSLALAGGRLYVTDDFGTLRTIDGRLDWYTPDQTMVLQPLTDDVQFWAPDAGKFKPGIQRLGVALYGPAEAVGLQVDGQKVDEEHHPLYSLRWDATPGSHTLIPLVRRPDGTWLEAQPRTVTVADDGIALARTGIVYPGFQSWVHGTITVEALSDWQNAEIKVDGQPLAHGTGLIKADWDTTTVADGFHRVSFAVEGSPYEDFREVLVFNGSLPPREPEDDHFVLYHDGQRLEYQGPLVPRMQDDLPLMPVHETARLLGFTAAFDAATRLITFAGQGRTATLNVDTGETTGMLVPLGTMKAVPAGDDFMVDWLVFAGLTGETGAGDFRNGIVIYRPQ